MPRQLNESHPADLSRGFGGARGALEGRTILQIVPRLDSGGAEQTTLDIAIALADAGARALVASQGGRLVGELQAKGGIFVPFPAAAKNPLVMAAAVRTLIGLIRRERADLVHVRSRAPGWVALAACRATRTPLVTTYHGAYSGQSPIKRRYNSVMAQGQVVIANSAYTAKLIADSYPSASDRIATIPRGIDLRAFTPAVIDPDRARQLRAQWGVAPDERIVLVPARLARRKGHATLVGAAAILAKKGAAGLVYVLAGDTDGHDGVRREIERAAAAAGIGNAVRCVGHCADMPAAYLTAAAVVVPSLIPETFGRVAVEAQAMGVPVVVTDIGAAVETVLAPPQAPAAARTGWRVTADSPAELANALESALGLGAAAREALGARARKHVSDRYSVERMRAATLEIYVRLLEHSHAAN